ncbi:CBL-interacting serine/threonine-protein kinase 2 [Dorcoceras hygrometricum]|uniref:CBL-interacting serine/threonine-protein kinase 2 n=1 Tax=Dorcoceras hygrometricum TaxID=472368 RepID=A0A2Z7CSD8_9LAMI|nr:CBL-interacting serine/threonine-protein kinase 2 [Dorcoceras hygrometricum]
MFMSATSVPFKWKSNVNVSNEFVCSGGTDMLTSSLHVEQQCLRLQGFLRPTEGLSDFSDVPKNLVYDARKIFSNSGEVVPRGKKKLLKYEYRLLNDILAKSITMKAGSLDAVTNERFQMMTAIHFGLKVNWSKVLFGVLEEMVDRTVKKAKGYEAQISVLLNSVPALTMGEATPFPSSKILSPKTSPESPPATSPCLETSTSSTILSMHFDADDIPLDDTADIQTSLPVGRTEFVEAIDDLRAFILHRIDDSNSEILSKLHTLERGLRETLHDQDANARKLINSVCQDAHTMSDVQKLHLNEVKKVVLAQGVTDGADSLEIRKEFKALDAKINSLDGQLGDIVDYVCGGDAKKGEGSSSRRPLPTPVNQGESSGSVVRTAEISQRVIDNAQRDIVERKMTADRERERSRGSRNCGRYRQSGPRPEPRLIRQPALEALTNSARTDSPRRVGRKRISGDDGRRRRRLVGERRGGAI